MRKGVFGAGYWDADKIKNIDHWPGEGNLCSITAQTLGGGGGPCNVLFDLAAMDPELPLYAGGRLGMDSEGDFLLSEIRRHHIDESMMVRSKTTATSYTDVMSGNGKRTFFCYRGANAAKGPADLANANVPARFFYLAYLLLLDTMDSDDPEYGTVAARVLDDMSKKGYETVVDFVSDAPERFRHIVTPSLPYIDYLIINEIEAASFFGKEIRRPDGTMNYANLTPAAQYLLDGGVRKLVVIHFPEGALAISKDDRKPLFAPSCHIETADIAGSCGAGDAYAAGVIYALHQGWDIKKTLDFASASSRFNLLSPTASDGAVSCQVMLDFLKNCQFNPIPEEFK